MTDFDDPLDDVLAAPVAAIPRTLSAAAPVSELHWENCPKCGGTGSWRGRGQCFACKGKGGRNFRASAADRAQNRVRAEDRRVRRAEESVADLAARMPEVHAWLVARAPTFEFAASLLEAVRKYGDLTERQLETAQRMMARDAERRAETQARVASAPTITVERIEQAFAAAQGNGVSRPKLRLDTFTFSLAPAHGKNAGSIYIKEDEQYLGRVTGGKFYSTRDCTEDQSARIVAVASDPSTSARAYGLRTGVCSCCGRTLTNGLSIELGIGPICRDKFGWGE